MTAFLTVEKAARSHWIFVVREYETVKRKNAATVKACFS